MNAAHVADLWEDLLTTAGALTTAAGLGGQRFSAATFLLSAGNAAHVQRLDELIAAINDSFPAALLPFAGQPARFNHDAGSRAHTRAQTDAIEALFTTIAATPEGQVPDAVANNATNARWCYVFYHMLRALDFPVATPADVKRIAQVACRYLIKPGSVTQPPTIADVRRDIYTAYDRLYSNSSLRVATCVKFLAELPRADNALPWANAAMAAGAAEGAEAGTASDVGTFFSSTRGVPVAEDRTVRSVSSRGTGPPLAEGEMRLFDIIRGVYNHNHSKTIKLYCKPLWKDLRGPVTTDTTAAAEEVIGSNLLFLFPSNPLGAAGAVGRRAQVLRLLVLDCWMMSAHASICRETAENEGQHVHSITGEERAALLQAVLLRRA